MKEFWIYTLARIALFAVTWGMVAGAWLLVTGEASLGWSLIVAFILSGIGSYVVLAGPREALAQRVQTRAASATTRYEEMRSKEDTD